MNRSLEQISRQPLYWKENQESDISEDIDISEDQKACILFLVISFTREMDREAWCAVVNGVGKSWSRLNN